MNLIHIDPRKNLGGCTIGRKNKIFSSKSWFSKIGSHKLLMLYIDRLFIFINSPRQTTTNQQKNKYNSNYPPSKESTTPWFDIFILCSITPIFTRQKINPQ